MAARVELAIEKELLERLKKGTVELNRTVEPPNKGPAILFSVERLSSLIVNYYVVRVLYGVSL